MADLDIKDIWAKGKKQQTEMLTVDVDDMIGKKSKTVLYWVKFILWIEFSITLISIPLIFLDWNEVYFKYLGENYLDYANPISIGIMVGYLVYFQFLIRQINRFDYAGDVKSSLTKIYNYLRFYILHYKVLVWAIYPISVMFGGYIGVMQAAESQGDQFAIGSTFFWAMFGITLVIGLLFSLLMNFLVNLIYGRKIKRLKRMVDELNA